MRSSLLPFVCFSLLLGAAHARADAPVTTAAPAAPAGPKHDARTDRLEGLSRDDLARLAPHLQHGPVALVEFANDDVDELPAINIALLVHAPASVVEGLVSDPTAYPKFVPTIDSVSVIEKTASTIIYDWAFDLAVLRMRGRNVMTIYRAPADRPDAASRIVIDSQEGDLGQGRMLFRIHPQGPQSCVLVLSMRLDLRQANYIARQMATAARSVNRTANLARGFSMALHFRKQAELAHPAVAQSAQPAQLTAPEIDMHVLSHLLDRGDLVLMQLAGDRLDQLSVIGLVCERSEKVHKALRDARAFGSELVPGASAQVVSEAGGVTTFDWSIALPLVGVSGRMRMDERKPVIAIDATSGALHGGRWLFDVKPLDKRLSLVTAWARFDFKDSTWLLEKLIDADPYLGHGITAASEIMLVRALRSRASDM
ncbi:MAG TPA: SRPBCC family protein [Polyangiales bacterium]